jgi:hypothetical protein
VANFFGCGNDLGELFSSFDEVQGGVLAAHGGQDLGEFVEMIAEIGLQALLLGRSGDLGEHRRVGGDGANQRHHLAGLAAEGDGLE